MISWFRRRLCRHDYIEHYGDLRADEPGGPRILHEIWWECRHCGKLLIKGCAPAFVEALHKERRG